jgi:tetratricopeptide (TPR) repeat protein
VGYSNKTERDEFLEKHQDDFSELLNRNLDQCPAPAELYRYFSKELASTEMAALEAHIDICPACTTALLALLAAEQENTETATMPAQWDQIEQELDNRFHQYVRPTSRQKPAKIDVSKKRSLLINKGMSFLQLISRPRTVAYSGAVIVLLIVSLYSYAWFSRPGYFQLVYLEKERNSVLRSESLQQGVLQEGLALYHNGNYSAAIDKFKAVLQQDPANYIAQYELGRSHLFVARTGLPGFPFRYDQSQVSQGIRHLKEALRLSNGNQFYQEDCYWNLGMAFLMLGDFAASGDYFNRIENLTHPNLSKREKARQMIQDIAQFIRSK